MSLKPWFLLDLVKGELLGGDGQGRGERRRPDLVFGTGCFSLLKRKGLMEKAAHTRIRARRPHWQILTLFSTPLPHQALLCSCVDGSGPYRTAPLNLTHGSIKPTVSGLGFPGMPP